MAFSALRSALISLHKVCLAEHTAPSSTLQYRVLGYPVLCNTLSCVILTALLWILPLAIATKTTVVRALTADDQESVVTFLYGQLTEVMISICVTQMAEQLFTSVLRSMHLWSNAPIT